MQVIYDHLRADDEPLRPLGGLEPDIFSYSSALSSCARALRWEAAIQVAQDLESIAKRPRNGAFRAETGLRSVVPERLNGIRAGAFDSFLGPS